MAEDDSGQPISSYADPAARDRFIAAMTALADRRTETGSAHPARLYVTVPSRGRGIERWPQRARRLAASLPPGTELTCYDNIFGAKNPRPEGPDAHQAWWQRYAEEQLDGLILRGRRNTVGKGRIFRLGPVARTEMITMVKLGKPVLLDAEEHGPVPLVDCRPRRYADPPRLTLRIPPAWHGPDSPTLTAALAALAASLNTTP